MELVDDPSDAEVNTPSDLNCVVLFVGVFCLCLSIRGPGLVHR